MLYYKINLLVESVINFTRVNLNITFIIINKVIETNYKIILKCLLYVNKGCANMMVQ